MLVYMKNSDYVHIHYIIMEIFDRTWSESEIFRNEYFQTEEEAYDALIARADMSRMYSVVPTTAIYRLALDKSEYS